MSLLLESIRYENGQFHNLELHEARMLRTVKKNFNLKKEIKVPKGLKKSRYKCRILYDKKIQAIEFSPYKRKKITSIKLVVDEKISYPHKYANRESILRHTRNIKKGKEVIFVKKGMLRDASYSNIALYNGTAWHTPAYPLLKGTKRQELIKNKIIIPKKIRPADLKKYSRISFINALNDLDELSMKL